MTFIYKILRRLKKKIKSNLSQTRLYNIFVIHMLYIYKDFTGL